MAKPRIPLPKQVEKVHRAETQYNRRREQQVSLDNGAFVPGSSLEVFIMTDQPETCRVCGARTNFRQIGKRQLHTCMACGKSYWLVEE